MNEEKVVKMISSGLLIGLVVGIYTNYKITQKYWVPWLLIPIGSSITGGTLAGGASFLMSK